MHFNLYIFQEAFMPFMHTIADNQPLFEVFMVLKNVYIQSIGPASNGVIPGLFHKALDMSARIKAEGQRIKANVLLAQQQARAELEDARVEKESHDAAVASARAEAKASKKAKTKVSSSNIYCYNIRLICPLSPRPSARTSPFLLKTSRTSLSRRTAVPANTRRATKVHAIMLRVSTRHVIMLPANHANIRRANTPPAISSAAPIRRANAGRRRAA